MGLAVHHRLRLPASQPEELAEAIRGSHLDACVMGKNPGGAELERVVFGRTCLDFASFDSPIWFTGQMPEDSHSLVYVCECPEQGHSFNFGMSHGSGYMGVFAPGAPIDAVTPAGYRNATLSVPAREFVRELEASDPEVSESVLVHGVGLKVPEEVRRCLDTLLATLHELADCEPGWLGCEQARLHMEADLLDVYIAAIRERDGGKELRPRAGRIRRYSTLRTVRDVVVAHRDKPLRLKELCGATGMSRRGLEYLFRDTLDIGVNAFVHRQRLHGARGALLRAEPEPGGVKRIALDWGFWHFGRFAREYRELFGECPNVTLAGGNEKS